MLFKQEEKKKSGSAEQGILLHALPDPWYTGILHQTSKYHKVFVKQISPLLDILFASTKTKPVTYHVA